MKPQWKDFETFDGISLSYADCGEGPAVILLHGFIVDSAVNWIEPGLLEALADTGSRAVALDARGHGRSDKPHDPQSFADRAMARDVIAMIELLDLGNVALIGYSMGGYTALEAALLDGRVLAVAACGVGVETDQDHSSNPQIVAELISETAPPDAFLRGAILPQIRPSDMAEIRVPVHVINGADDYHDPSQVAGLFPDAIPVTVEGDHISAVTEPTFRDALVAFVRCCSR